MTVKVFLAQNMRLSMEKTVLRNRDRTIIISTILKVTGNGATKTKIMYLSQLSYKQLGDYLPYLLDIKLIEFDEDSKLYYTTDKGKILLKKIEEIMEVLGTTGGSAGAPDKRRKG